MAHEWGSLFVITSNNKIHRFDELDLASRLEYLYRKNLFTLAINLAQTSSTPSAGSTSVGGPGGSAPSQAGGAGASYDKDLVADIYRRYGDHLYRLVTIYSHSSLLTLSLFSFPLPVADPTHAQPPGRC